MWGFGGKFYWGRNETGGKIEGIVVVFAWMSSQEKHLKNYVQLYSSLGWNSLICHPEFLNVFFPEKATSLASDILNELVKELKTRPCPVVFASFSGGPKACMYKVLQIIEGKCEAQLNPDEYRLVRDCVAGHIYDSCPTDFTSDMGTRFLLKPTVLKVPHPPRLVSWIANGIASSLDALFLNRFESQRAEYWQTLYSSVFMGAPYLILCSEDDDLAPYQIICNFAQRLQELGGDVKLVKWNSSPHVDHYRYHMIDYKAAVTELLEKAAIIYSQRIRRLEAERMSLEVHDETSSPICQPKKATTSSNECFGRVALELNDHFISPSSLEYQEGRNVGSVRNEHKEGLIHLSSLPSINAHGVFGQILFDVCVPKDVEDWDIRSSGSSNAPASARTRRHAPFNPIRCIRRSRL